MPVKLTTNSILQLSGDVAGKKMLCVRAYSLWRCQAFDCRLSPVTAVAMSCSALSLLHSFQNFIVAL